MIMARRLWLTLLALGLLGCATPPTDPAPPTELAPPTAVAQVTPTITAVTPTTTPTATATATESPSPTAVPPTATPSPTIPMTPSAPNRRVPMEEQQLTFMLPFDAIQPIYEPRFAAAAEAPLADDELVMGVSWGGEAKAYPVSVLRFREMVIDELAGIPILVSW